jgi:hypothetical protein
MNEQYKELIKQAGTDVSGKWISIDNAEKFAELIVRECMSNLYLNGYDDAVMQIKKHFGVEL